MAEYDGDEAASCGPQGQFTGPSVCLLLFLSFPHHVSDTNPLHVHSLTVDCLHFCIYLFNLVMFSGIPNFNTLSEFFSFDGTFYIHSCVVVGSVVR